MSDAVVRTEGWRRLPAALLPILAVAVAYYLGGLIGLHQRVVVNDAEVTPLWLPTGIAVTSLLWLGLRAWPGIALGTYLTIEQITDFDLPGLIIVAGNVLAPVCAYLMLRRAGFRTEMDRLRDALALVFLGGLWPMLISATIGTWTLVLTGDLPLSQFWPVWSAWWAGDAMGVLVLTPCSSSCAGSWGPGGPWTATARPRRRSWRSPQSSSPWRPPGAPSRCSSSSSP